MAIYRALLSFQHDSALPRDAVTLSPHFSGDDPGALATALKTNIAAQPGVPITSYSVKVYDAEKLPPSYPLATATGGSGTLAMSCPREIALCLSYYSGFNRKSYRGRLYIPAGWSSSAVGLRPSAAQITNALEMRKMFTTGMPANTHWIIYSRKLKQGFKVTNTWVDDEWDIMRSRGLRGTTRQLAGGAP